MSTPVQSSAVPLSISFDAGVTYKPLVCLENYNIESTKQTNPSDTFCGRYIGLGPVSTQISGSAVADTAPLASQATQKDMNAAMNAETVIYVRANYPTAGSMGGQISNNAQGFVTQVGEQFAVNNLVKYTFTILINGGIF